MPRLHSGAAIDRPETIKLPSIAEIVRQQLQETHSIDMHKNSTTNINNSTHTPNFERKNDVESLTLLIRDTSTQVSGSDAELFPENQTRSTPVQCPIDAKKQQLEIQRNENNMTAKDEGDNISPLNIKISQIEERLVRNDITNEL